MEKALTEFEGVAPELKLGVAGSFGFALGGGEGRAGGEEGICARRASRDVCQWGSKESA